MRMSQHGYPLPVPIAFSRLGDRTLVLLTRTVSSLKIDGTGDPSSENITLLRRLLSGTAC
jgi:hypothetical protein